ncbi:MAG TPA: sulfatase, partial [Streptosporangiaceae bacterium]|nr:sulfatase [Streptosporangiaceae bacterium]
MRRAGFVLLILGAAACRPRPTNLLLVSIDTLRADHLGCYGDAAAQTTRLDQLAARGTRFTRAFTVAPLTLPAHASLMTGTFPAFHGVHDNGGFHLGDEQLTLAEVLRDHGYRTGGFVGAFVLDGRWGIGQGFERYFDDFDLAKHEGQGMDAVQRRGDEVVDEALRWLAADRGRPFFAWVHLYDPHSPYDAPEPWRSRFPASVVGSYDAEIAWTDSQVGRLIDALAADGRLERTLVAVVADHGESLGEHQEQQHGFFLYEATLHIPLILAGPRIPARTVSDPVRIVDAMPTLLEDLGVQVPAAVQGRSLLPLVEGRSDPRLTLAET